MKHISNKQKAEQISQNHKNFYYLESGTPTTSALECYHSAMEMAQWKDKERKELWRITRNHYQEWAEEQIAQEKQKLIDEACKWLLLHDSYAKPTHLQVDRLREHLNNIK